MKRVVVYLGLTICLVVKSLAVNVEFRIANYKDNKKCAISYTFDDGMLEHYTQVFQQMEKYGFKGTFFVCGKNIRTKTLPDEKTFMSWEQLKEMSDRGHEISNHTWSHANLVNLSWEDAMKEIAMNDSVIETMTGKKPMTLCYPWNAFNEILQQWVMEKKVAARIYQYALCGGNARSTVESLTNWVNELMVSGDWGVTMTHGINYGFDYFPDPTVLWRHFNWIKEHESDVWVAPFVKVGAYLKERDNIRLRINKHLNTYQITPLLDLDRDVYNENLTMTVQGIDCIISAEQDGKQLKVRKLDDCYIFDFNPFGGAVNVNTELSPEEKYMNLQKQLARGWNTWDTRSVLTHVFLPYGFGIDLNLMDVDGKRVDKFKIQKRTFLYFQKFGLLLIQYLMRKRHW